MSTIPNLQFRPYPPTLPEKRMPDAKLQMETVLIRHRECRQKVVSTRNQGEHPSRLPGGDPRPPLFSTNRYLLYRTSALVVHLAILAILASLHLSQTHPNRAHLPVADLPPCRSQTTSRACLTVSVTLNPLKSSVCHRKACAYAKVQETCEIASPQNWAGPCRQIHRGDPRMYRPRLELNNVHHPCHCRHRNGLNYLSERAPRLNLALPPLRTPVWPRPSCPAPLAHRPDDARRLTVGHTRPLQIRSLVRRFVHMSLNRAVTMIVPYVLVAGLI